MRLKPGKAFLHFLVIVWSRIRGVPKAQRFTALFAVLITASALRVRNHHKNKTTPSSLSARRKKRRTSLPPYISSKMQDSPSDHPLAASKSTSSPISSTISSTTTTATTTTAANATIATITPATTTTTTTTRSLLSGLSDVGSWIEQLYQSVIHRAILFKMKTSTAAVAALSATTDFIENTRTVVQTKAAAAITKTALKNIDPLVDMVSLQVKMRIKDKDMPTFILKMIDETVDAIMPDIKDEFHRRTLEVRDTYLSPAMKLRKRRKRTTGRKTSTPGTNGRPTSRIKFTYDENPSTTPMDQIKRSLSFGQDATLQDEHFVLGAPPSSSTRSCSSRNMCLKYYQTSLKAIRRVGHHVRAFVLYTMHPYDRTIWSQVNNYKWIACTSLGLIPIVGQLFWLFVFAIKNKKDEYQVIDFIVGFQVARFLTQGLFFFMYGCGLYYRCVNFEMDCTTRGPSLSIWGASYFTIQIVTVWSAFFMLPFTKKIIMTPEVRQAHAMGRVICVDRPPGIGNGWIGCMGGGAPRRLPALSPSPRGSPRGLQKGSSKGSPRGSFSSVLTLSKSRSRTRSRSVSSEYVKDEMNEDGIVYIYDEEGVLVNDMTVDGRAWNDDHRLRREETQRGGHLVKLFWYGTLTTSIAVVFVCLALGTMEGWRLRATLFWIRTLYCLFLCPFVIFKIPMMMRLLTRARKTGYDMTGRTCVAKKTPKFGESDNKASKSNKRFGAERNETNRSPVVAAVANAMWNKRTKKQIKVLPSVVNPFIVDRPTPIRRGSIKQSK